jgi:hypothetical protein
MRAWILLVLVAGCADEERLNARWDAFVADHAACEVAEDCALVYPGCPLGCFNAVNVAFVDEAEAEAARLVRAYERWGRACVYDCAAAGPPTCDDGRCAVEADFGE